LADSTAWAIEVCEANFSLLISEAGRNHTKEQIRAKIPAYEGGFFLRDPSSKLDCQFFTPEAFTKLYRFRLVHDGKSPLQEVIRI
jgi:hypothetical protein